MEWEDGRLKDCPGSAARQASVLKMMELTPDAEAAERLAAAVQAQVVLAPPWR